jgi:hypothetical protein
MVIRTLIHLKEPDRNLDDVEKVWLQTWMHANAKLINEDGTFPFLQLAKRELANNGRVDPYRVAPTYRFLLVRAAPAHPDAWLTNRLISDFTTFDFVTRYVFNKQGFYADYEAYSQAYRAHVVETLKRTYLNDKAAFRERMYGLTDD